MRRLLLLFLPAALAAQSPDPVLSLLDEARAQPVELFADVAFRLLPRLSAPRQIATLEQIFERAGEARDPFPSIYPDPTAVDALSLRTRAIRYMLRFDAKKGRALFEAMAHPAVPRASCTDRVAFDAGVYIDTVEAVFRQGYFSEEERKKGVPWSIVIAAVRQSASSAEIASAGRLAPLARTEAEGAELISALAAALTLQDSDRGFTSVPPSRLVGNIHNLRTFRTLPSSAPVLFALRDYLVRHLTAARCEIAGPASDGLAEFNRAIEGRADLLPLTPEESKPAKREGKPEAPSVDPGYASLSRRMAALLPRGPGDRNRMAPEWSDSARSLLSDIESWKGATGQDPAAVAFDRLALLMKLVDMAPAGVIHQAALAAALNTLGDPAFLLFSPARWLSEMRYFVTLGVALTPEALAALRSAGGIPGFAYQTGREIPDLLIASRSPALSLYGRMMLLDR